MLSGFFRALWGDLSKTELKKFGFLSCIIMFILGNYWMLRVMKNSFFNDLVGFELQPYAKITSIFVVAIVILIYSKLVDLFQKHMLFYIFCGFYGLLFLFLGFATDNPETFSLSSSSSLYPYFQWIPGKFIGWLTYWSFESSSLLMILFWAFVASTTKPESAKKGYGMIVSCIQIGTITGPFIVTKYATRIGSPRILLMGSLIVLFVVPFLVNLYMKVIPAEQDPAQTSKKVEKKTGFFEGLRLIVTKPYVLCILVVSTIYEVISSILEFQMNMIAKDIFPTRDLFSAFTGKYGMSINALALVFALIGTSFFMRKLGLKKCLIAYPTAIGVVLIALLGINFMGAENITIMWVLFGSMIAVKGFSYALNNPTKEVMYIPTTKDIRYKAKGWIESFGGRTSKGMGSGVTAVFAHNLPGLLLFGTIISLGVVGIWLVVATMLGNKFNKLQKTNSIID